MPSLQEASRNMTDSQDRILYQIKRLGPQTVRSLASDLGMTTMGVRQHLRQLDEEQLTEAMPEQAQSRGRPARRWKLTRGGHGRFPDGHGKITSELIASVRDLMGESAVDQLIEKRTRDALAQYREKLSGQHDLAERLRMLADLRSEEGYMAESSQLPDGTFVLMEHHCPICVAATACQGFCRSELEVFQSIFADCATVTREDHLLHGARRCSYRLTPLTPDRVRMTSPDRADRFT